MRILHSGDWHLDSPMHGHDPQTRQMLRNKLLEVPGKISRLCVEENCDLVLLSGDLFDGGYTQQGYRAVYEALRAMQVPVFVSPGNHDYMDPASPWMKELWPENVHIFTKARVESVAVPALDCRVYGAGFEEKDCPALLEGFCARQEQTYAVGVFHADPTQIRSPYNPVTARQVQNSGLDYLALGHIHKADSFRAGKTLCAWPGCPMGTGYDEQGVKGVYIVELGETTQCRFVSLDFPCFYDLYVPAGEDPAQALAGVLPGVESEDFYRVTLTGECEKVDLTALARQFSGFTALVLRDQTTAPVDIWANAGQDSFEGMYFGLLKERLAQAAEDEKEIILLAAKLSRQILSGEEVVLP